MESVDMGLQGLIIIFFVDFSFILTKFSTLFLWSRNAQVGINVHSSFGYTLLSEDHQRKPKPERLKKLWKVTSYGWDFFFSLSSYTFDTMKSKETAQYIELLERTLELCYQKQDFQQRVINNYGTAKAAIYIESIKDIEEVINSNVKKMEQLKRSSGEKKAQG